MKRISPAGFLSIVLFAFGISYLDFGDLSFMNNIRPYIMLLMGLLVFVFTFKRRK